MSPMPTPHEPVQPTPVRSAPRGSGGVGRAPKRVEVMLHDLPEPKTHADDDSRNSVEVWDALVNALAYTQTTPVPHFAQHVVREVLAALDAQQPSGGVTAAEWEAGAMAWRAKAQQWATDLKTREAQIAELRRQRGEIVALFRAGHPIVVTTYGENSAGVDPTSDWRVCGGCAEEWPCLQIRELDAVLATHADS